MALSVRYAALASALIIGGGTAYSIAYSTYLDTSDPLVSHLPHPLHKTHWFAYKENPLNVIFIKRLWFWTTACFAALFYTSPPTAQTYGRLYKYSVATVTWLVFTSWFFGPAILERFIALTGGECTVTLPTGYVVTLPVQYCYPGENKHISPATHPSLFAASLLVPGGRWNARPRMRRGHDVSGHLFILTMSCLFLTDQLAESLRTRVRGNDLQRYASYIVSGVIALEFFAMYITSVYFHTAQEKASGFSKSENLSLDHHRVFKQPQCWAWRAICLRNCRSSKIRLLLRRSRCKRQTQAQRTETLYESLRELNEAL
jgi:hypothetical protein